MSIKTIANKIIEKIVRKYIIRKYINYPGHRGIDFIQDIKKSLPNYRFKKIFDVGANVGQSSKIYLSRLPNSYIYCFEPASETFHKLKKNLNYSERVNFYQLALGASNRVGKLVVSGSSEMFHLLDNPNSPSLENNVATESVDIVTLDEFCKENNIDHISFLKVDTEGADLEVLKGSTTMLSEQRIDFIQLETGMNPYNNYHVPFESIKSFLEDYKYFIFGIYEQMHEWPEKEPHLRRTDPIFISYRMIKNNKI